MTPRVLIGGFMHEVHTFARGVLTLDDMRRNGFVASGDELLDGSIGADQEIHGAIEVALAEGIDLVPASHAFGGVGPRVADAAFEVLRAGILDVARANAGRLDGAYLVLHGAMATEHEDDPEGLVLSELRELLGPEVPIVASFDLHAHMTERMVRSASAIVAYQTIPHVDFLETGQRSMRILIDAMRGSRRPVSRQRKIRMIASSEKHDTNHGPMVEVMARAREMERRPGIIAVSVTPTQPWMDVPELGWSVIVVADGDAGLAQATADELAWMIWDRRERYLVTKVPVARAVEEAMATPGRPVVLADGADSPSAGASGDGNDLLRELVRIGYEGDALLAIVDPAAAAACHAAGLGATVTLTLGGALTPETYQPLEVTGVVEALRDGRYMVELPVRPADIGPTAVLRIGGVRAVVSTRKAFQLDESVYHQAGLDPRTADIVQAKSAGGFRGVYEPFAARIIEMDTPGLTTHDLPTLPFQRIPRPMWPWDMDLDSPWLDATRPEEEPTR
jgi:microcystin degradation protein MlrC